VFYKVRRRLFEKENMDIETDLTIDFTQTEKFKRDCQSVLKFIEKREPVKFRHFNAEFPNGYHLNCALDSLEREGLIRRGGGVNITEFYAGGKAIEPFKKVTRNEFIKNAVGAKSTSIYKF